MTTAQTTPAADGGYAEAHAFANALRSVADVIDDGELHPTASVRIYCTQWADPNGREVFLAARRLFPAAPASEDEHYVSIAVGKGVSLLFDKGSLGTRREVQRPVIEYVIDPELLAPVSA